MSTSLTLMYKERYRIYYSAYLTHTLERYYLAPHGVLAATAGLTKT
jgi:hypothetical protein